MGITSLVVKQKEFAMRFRGFDVHEVDDFLEKISDELEKLNQTIENLQEKNHQINLENQGYKEKEHSIKDALLESQKVIDQMKENAKKSAEIVLAQANIEAEKILRHANSRLIQLHGDINELKRQRLQLEMQITHIIEAHSKLLEETKTENKTADEDHSSVKFIKKA